MQIHGLQKMTLLDFPGKVACTVFLGGCDFRCPFCHNWDILDPSTPVIMEEDEFYKFLDKREGLLDGVAITGGEPLLRTGMADFIKGIKSRGFLVKLDTNGNHPDRLKELVSEGLIDYVAVDVKNNKERYGETVGIPMLDISKIEETISFLLEGNVPYEFRTTVLRQFHDADSFKGIAEWIEGAEHYFIQSFVDRETVPFSGLEAYSPEELEEFKKLVEPHVKHIDIRGV
ncbi:MAG: anaerobic ribonucleoside-triphosphate reductase activating protein [Eubacterium sp.]|nr:anaerobic ribonucleoside-triphosphate reductase activating protein [Eubacterium sp.]